MNNTSEWCSFQGCEYQHQNGVAKLEHEVSDKPPRGYAAKPNGAWILKEPHIVDWFGKIDLTGHGMLIP